MIQKTLFEGMGKNITLLENVPIEKIKISPANPRKTISAKHVDALAQSIEKNGFDGTLAIKCHQANDFYLVFAGSNRLKACEKIGIKSMPVFLYQGYSDEELWRMAYEDNEQADVQAQFNIVDVWMDYKAKSEAGWTQQKIADVLGVSRPTVVYRIQLCCLPNLVLTKIVNTDFLKERHCLELLELSTVDIFTHEILLCEIIDNVLSRTKEPTSAQFKAEVEKYNAFIQSAEAWHSKLNSEFQNEFLQLIKAIRTTAGVEAAGIAIYKKQTEAAQALMDEKIKALNEEEAKVLEAKKQAEKNEKIQEILNRVQYGDARDLTLNFPSEIKLLFTDPPYGKDFQSNRRIKTEKAAKIENDADIETAILVFENVLKNLYPKMSENSAALVWCDWKYEKEFADSLQKHGFDIKNSIVWIKSNHGTGDLSGSFAPKHERLLFATKGRPIFNEEGRLPDVLSGSEFPNTEHPTPKPVDLIERIIQHLTYQGDIIVDPFMGCGTTGIASVRNNRIFWGCENFKKYHDEALENINKIIKNGI